MNLQQIGIVLFCALAVLFAPAIFHMIRLAFHRYFILSTNTGAGNHSAPNDDKKAAETDDETNSETTETPQLDAETEAEIITFGENQALARLVAAGKIGLTEAVKIGAGAKSGERYQKRSREIKQIVTELQAPAYPELEAARKPTWKGEEIEV